jgi:uncharacterized protein (UPF0276 family)
MAAGVVAAVEVEAAVAAGNKGPRSELPSPAPQDRVGLGWRPELAAGMWLALDRIDIVEVIADNHFRAGKRERAALRSLARQVPLTLHGVGLGLASSLPCDERRLDALARLVDAVAPAYWSEHLAFVRAGGIEIGHLAAPPRTAANVAGSVRNIERAVQVVGARPVLENIATLVEPPACGLDEPGWISAILSASDADLLLDLHNLYANALNARLDPFALLEAMPLTRVRTVHLSGGVWIDSAEGHRLLDDHLHDPPDPVYALLERLTALVPQPLDVIVERDGNFPRMGVLLSQIERVRAAIAAGRAWRHTCERRCA